MHIRCDFTMTFQLPTNHMQQLDRTECHVYNATCAAKSMSVMAAAAAKKYPHIHTAIIECGGWVGFVVSGQAQFNYLLDWQ